MRQVAYAEIYQNKTKAAKELGVRSQTILGAIKRVRDNPERYKDLHEIKTRIAQNCFANAENAIDRIEVALETATASEAANVLDKSVKNALLLLGQPTQILENQQVDPLTGTYKTLVGLWTKLLTQYQDTAETRAGFCTDVITQFFGWIETEHGQTPEQTLARVLELSR